MYKKTLKELVLVGAVEFWDKKEQDYFAYRGISKHPVLAYTLIDIDSALYTEDEVFIMPNTIKNKLTITQAKKKYPELFF